MLDSTAVFKARLKAIGVPDSEATKLLANDLDTLAKFAYITSIQPGLGDDAPFVKVISTTLGYTDDNPIGPGLLSSLRRLWFESHTVAISEIRQKVEKVDDTPSKLPFPEREVKRISQQARLAGVIIEGELEPSHALVDIAYSIRETDILKYIDPSLCTTREQELRGVKKDTWVRADPSTGNLKSISKDQMFYTDVSSEHKLRMALQRRSIAMDQLDLLPYLTSERYHNFLFALLSRQVPSTHQSVSVEQVLQIDKQVWIKMSESCRSGLARDAGGNYPVDLALQEALKDPVVGVMMQPVARSGSSSNQYGGQRWSDNNSMQSNFRRNVPYEPYKGGKGAKGSGKGKYSKGGKSKQSNWVDRVPAELRGGSSRTKRGERVCFNWNLNGCDGAEAGKSCQKGIHLCCGCFSRDHTFKDCPRKK